MGNPVSKAEAEVDKAETDINELMNIFEAKRSEFIQRIKSTRGEGSDTSREVQGGRSVSRVSEIRVAKNAGADPGIADAIGAFFEAAQGGEKGKEAAVRGAEKLISVGINALFGVSGGTGLERTSFVVLFMNLSFVRVDYYIYSYSLTGAKWGAKASKSGSVYVADISVLSYNDLQPAEIDFLLAQALFVPPPKIDNTLNQLSTPVTGQEITIITKLKIQLVASAILSRLLDDEALTLEKLQQITKELVATQNLISSEFASLPDFVPSSE